MEQGKSTEVLTYLEMPQYGNFPSVPDYGNHLGYLFKMKVPRSPPAYSVSVSITR